MHPKNLSIQDFVYELPEERIATYPLPVRHDSKLLIFNNKNLEISRYLELATHLPKDSFLIFNNTKVVEARILFQKSTGARIEIFCLEPSEAYRDISTAMSQKGSVFWKCLIGGAKKWKGPVLEKTIDAGTKQIYLTARRVRQNSDDYLIEFCWNDLDLSFAELLHLAGLIPLPPYLNRSAESSDQERYQTIYAEYDGSVAAPTAGLHFTDEVMGRLQDKNIFQDFVTLHVGAGTFKPVKADQMRDHEMHAEFIEVNKTLIEHLIERIGNPVILVGTTSMRTIESLYWLGLRTYRNPGISLDDLTVYQWDPYREDGTSDGDLDATTALQSLIKWMDTQGLKKLITKTQIIIAPGYEFKIAGGLITNFHQPQSTLLLLVAAMIGDQWKKMYQFALENDYRFLSYGDGCLILK